MTKVDFHILPSIQEEDRLLYVARLTQKARSQSLNVLIAVEDGSHKSALSTALWNLSSESFLAHESIEENHCSIQISENNNCGEHHQVLINLRKQTPDYFSRFERVFEVVSQEPSVLATSRERYRFYKDRGYPLSQHDLRDRV